MTKNKIKYNTKTKLPARKRIANTAVLIVIILCFLVTVFPFAIVVINSAKSSLEIINEPVAMPGNWGQLFRNIAEVWKSNSVRYPTSLLSSIVITVFSLFFIAIFSSMSAWVLVRTKTKMSAFIFLVFISGLIIPFQVVMFPLVQLFSASYKVLGIKMLRTYHGMVMAYVGFGAPLSVFMFHGFIKSIPLELEEAATIEGYGRWKIYRKIILPILQPIVVTVLILNGIWIWNDFLLPSLVLGVGNKIQTIPLAVRFFAGSFVKKWDLIMTAVLMAAFPIIILFLFGQKYIISGMVSGAIK